MCFAKKTSGVGPRRAFRCASYSAWFRSANDSVRLCDCRRAPIISICCPAIAAVAIAHLVLLLNSRLSSTYERAGIAIGGGDLYYRVVFRLKEGGTTPARSLVVTYLKYVTKIATKSSLPPASLHFLLADSASLLLH